MKKNKLLILATAAITALALTFTACGGGAAKKENTDNNKISIVTTIFPPYDFAREMAGDKADVTMLLKPGAESHTFDPSPQDIIKIQNSDVFIYVGGDSDEWVKKILLNINPDHTKIIKLMDLVKLQDEVLVKGMQPEADEDEDEDEVEKDEHVWTSIENDETICKAITDTLKTIDSENSSYYEERLDKYTKELEDMKTQFADMINSAKRKTIVVGDRFPFAYFAKEFGLEYYAAFPGCSADTDANPATIAFLIDKVKEDKIPVVFHIELSNEKIADTVCEATGAKKLLLQSGHNVSAKDFENHVTYLDLLKNNLKTLKEALN